MHWTRAAENFATPGTIIVFRPESFAVRLV
jgi:hypothetical protein